MSEASLHQAALTIGALCRDRGRKGSLAGQWGGGGGSPTFGNVKKSNREICFKVPGHSGGWGEKGQVPFPLHLGGTGARGTVLVMC